MISTVGGPLEVGAVLDGTVSVVFVSVGTAVEAGNTLAILVGKSGQEVRVRTPAAGTVIEVATQDCDIIRSGSGIATIQLVNENLVAIGLIPAGQYGYITGVVASVADTPMSTSRVQQFVGRVAGYQCLETVNEPLIKVQIELDSDESNPSGLAWSIGSGPDYSLVAGTPWSGVSCNLQFT